MAPDHNGDQGTPLTGVPTEQFGRLVDEPPASFFTRAGQDAAGRVVNWPTPDPVFGFHDEQGRSLIEFRVHDGRVEAKYYDSDMDAAAHAFVNYLLSMKEVG